MSELSISQTSDAPTESSKSSTGEIPEELCNLPLDTTIIKSEQEKEEPDAKTTKIDDIVIVSAVTESISKSQKSDVTEPKDDTSKKLGEAAKSKPEPKSQKQESKDIKSAKNENALNKSNKSQDVKPEAAAKKIETNTPKSNIQGKGNQTAAKGKTSEPKPKENDKPKSPETTVEAVTPIASAPSLPEPEKVY